MCQENKVYRRKVAKPSQEQSIHCKVLPGHGKTWQHQSSTLRGQGHLQTRLGQPTVTAYLLIKEEQNLIGLRHKVYFLEIYFNEKITEVQIGVA